MIAKYNEDNEMEWQKKLNNNGKEQCKIKSVKEQKNGDIIIVGSVEGEISDENNNHIIAEGDTDGIIAKYSTDGTLKWLKKIGGKESDNLQDICISDKNEIFAVG